MAEEERRLEKQWKVKIEGGIGIESEEEGEKIERG